MSRRFVVDLRACENHGQCALTSPGLFALDDDSELSFHSEADGAYVSGELSETEVISAARAASVCPMQAISLDQ